MNHDIIYEVSPFHLLEILNEILSIKDLNMIIKDYYWDHPPVFIKLQRYFFMKGLESSLGEIDVDDALNLEEKDIGRYGTKWLDEYQDQFVVVWISPNHFYCQKSHRWSTSCNKKHSLYPDSYHKEKIQVFGAVFPKMVDKKGNTFADEEIWSKLKENVQFIPQNPLH